MTQHDGNIANQAMPSARTDINNALSAIFTLQSGTSAPATTFANMFWADTTTNLLKQRNTADSAWLIKYVLDSNGLNRLNAGNPNGSITGNYEGELLYDTTNDLLWVYTGSTTVWNLLGSKRITTTKTANYTATIADDIIYLDATSGSFTLTLYTAVGNAGRSLTLIRTDNSANTVTIDGNASETIDGLATFLIYPNQTVEITGNGTNWNSTKEQGGGWVTIREQTFSSVSIVDFINIGDYDEYELVLEDLLPATNGAVAQMRVSTDNGATFIDTTNSYVTQEQAIVGATVSAGLTTSTFATLSQGLSSTAGNGGDFIIRFTGLRNATANTRFFSIGKGVNSTPAHASWIYFGERDADEAHNAIRILNSLGSNMSGIARLRGLK